MIPYSRQDINQADIDAVTDVLKSDYLTQGPKVPLFEKVVSEYCVAKYAVAVNSASSALHIACLALDLKEGDWLWTSPNTFVASANCGLYCGAQVDFVDIDPDTFNLCPHKLEKKLIEAKAENKLPKIVIPVHFAGQSCDMESIHQLSQQYGFKIIEDASHAIGAAYQGKPVGNCRYSDITVFSFHPVKIITTGEGGMALTNDAELENSMNLLRSHGITRKLVDVDKLLESEIWNYQQVKLGFNYRMADIAAALGVSQMTRLGESIEKRHAIAKMYDEELAHLPVMTSKQHLHSYSSYHLYPIRLQLKEIRKTQREVYDALRSRDVQVNLHYIPIYLQPYFKALGFKRGYCSEAESYYSEALSIPMYPTLAKEQMEHVITSIKEVI
jgi:UDP-4-amino-4,6-dideoxy-N-acetyl-beta-L-altrosamine transaminase